MERTVEDLIEELKGMDKDKIVVVVNCYGGGEETNFEVDEMKERVLIYG